MTLAQSPFSYRSDPDVPDFDDTAPVAFMDGECTLCSFGARMIHRLDRTQTFRICPIQTDLGRAMLTHLGLDPQDPWTWVFLDQGRAYHSFDALIQVGKRTGGIGHALRLFGLLPRPVRDWMYLRVARNRYAMFGRKEMCTLPDPAFRARLMLG
jgi:predicted DCC family thiol-disulfide oxidoreductase YuxK